MDTTPVVAGILAIWITFMTAAQFYVVSLSNSKHKKEDDLHFLAKMAFYAVYFLGLWWLIWASIPFLQSSTF